MHYAQEHPLPRNPKGWFAVELSHALKRGDVKPVSAVGRDLVVFRTAGGEVGVLDAYCPHLGAHLGYGGQVEGEVLRCPFHRWGFAVDGACRDIPYGGAAVPARASLPGLAVRERNGAVLAWFGGEGDGPEWEVPEMAGEAWSETRWLELRYRAHIQEFAENGVDLGHFPVVHGSNRAGVELIDAVGLPFRFKLQTAYPGDGIGLPGQHVDVDTEWFYYGVSVFLGVSTAAEFGTQVRQIFHFTPVPGDEIVLRVGFSANLSTIPEGMVEEVQAKNLQILVQNLEEDRDIWRYKRYLTRPALVPGDGPFGTLRRWTRQFYPASGVPLPARQEASEAELADPVAPTTRAEVAVPAVAAERTVEETILLGLPASFDAKAAGGRSFVVQYDISGAEGGFWFAGVHDGVCRPEAGRHAAPTVTVSVSAADWLAIDEGTLGRAKAFMTRRLTVKGDLGLAYRLGEIFRG